MAVSPDVVDYVRIAAIIAAGFCMGIGSLGPALGMGYIGGQACKSIGQRPEGANVIRTTTFMAMGLTETPVIFNFVIALILLFVVS